MTHARTFVRRLDALASIFAFTEEVLRDEDAVLRPSVDFVLEELFTNILKYGRGTVPVIVRIAPISGGVEVTFDEPEADRFDVTQAPSVDIDAPTAQREAGGLGLHLIAELVDTMSYTYDAAGRVGRTTFRKTRRDSPSSPT